MRDRGPQISGSVIRDPEDGRVVLVFENVGSAVATGVVYIAKAPSLEIGGAVTPGSLDVGEVWRGRLPETWVGAETVYLVWGWQDADRNVHLRNDAGGIKRFSRRQYRRRPDSSLAAMFREMYPDVQLGPL